MHKHPCTAPTTIRIPYRVAAHGRMLFFREHRHADIVIWSAMIRKGSGPDHGLRAKARRVMGT